MAIHQLSGQGHRAALFVDPTDTDNPELMITLLSVYGPGEVAVVLTGRCALPPEEIEAFYAGAQPTAEQVAAFNARWDYDYSRQLLEASALRFRKLAGMFCSSAVPIFDGGLARAPVTPHQLHMEDFEGFEDLTPEEVAQIKAKEVFHLTPLAEFDKFIGGVQFEAFLGGPATGLYELLTQQPNLISALTGVYAQFGSLGQVTGMMFEGRQHGAQYNVKMDPLAGQRLSQLLAAKQVPFYLAPTEVTRQSEIGFGTPEAIERILDPDCLGYLELCRQRRIWYERAIKPREGEVLLTHDLATLFLFLQVSEQCDPIYKLQPAAIEIEVGGDADGTISVDFARTESTTVVATKLLDPRKYLALLTATLRHVDSATPRQVFLSSSLSPEEMRDPLVMRQYHQRILTAVLPLLRKGATLHVGSHPAIKELSCALVRLFPEQLVQHLLSKRFQDRLPYLSESSIRWYDSLESLHLGLVKGKEYGVFIAGRTDIEYTQSGCSGVFIEYALHRMVNPEAEDYFDTTIGGVSKFISALEAFHLVEDIFPTQESWQKLGQALGGA